MATTTKVFKPSDEFNKLSAEWMQVSEELTQKKVRELELRNALIKLVFPKGVPVGTNNIALPEGWVAKFKGTENAKVDETLIAETRQLIESQAKAGKIPEFSLDEVIKFKPGLSMEGFKALTAEQQNVVKNCVTFTPGQAGLEITKPKRAIK